MVSSWNRREILVAAVHFCLYPTARLGTALAEAEYINNIHLTEGRVLQVFHFRESFRSQISNFACPQSQ